VKEKRKLQIGKNMTFFISSHFFVLFMQPLLCKMSSSRFASNGSTFYYKVSFMYNYIKIYMYKCTNKYI